MICILVVELPGVIHVTRNRFYKLQTTRSWDYLGLSSTSLSNLLNKSKMGNGVIIGLLDTGIWPELEVFNDGNLGPIPSRWKGVCESGEHFDASTVDRSFPTPITLGNNHTIIGQAMFTGEDTVSATLVYPEVSDLMAPRNCESLSSDDDWMVGKVVLCFASDYNQGLLDYGISSVKKAGGLGVIVSRSASNYFYSSLTNFPSVQVTYEIGTQILYYIRSTSNPQVMLSPSRTHIGKPVSTNVAYFSSRGPSSNAPAILKDWSPAAIKSAIITTALVSQESGGPIFAEGEPPKLADPFDFGGGIVNPNNAADPGLVYDMNTEDYVQYLCAMGHSNSDIFQLTEHPIVCPSKQPSLLDVNLPSITIPSLKKPTILTRTVTNVGPVNSKYKANIESTSGINIAVRPDTLIFTSKTKTISFSVMITSTHNVNAGYYFGSLTWTDGVHVVRSPISVRTEVGESIS
ncbi:hypothetical protein V6N12_037654 [Hibiscus sabdariffa]|uniref:Subtilisin-like protease fibronectin type-III domain-containing protein n=1 Tax=Hibiscus sabdariffa TaxID=183260 RepID=A0ABR2C1C7_9ROSI